MPKQSRENQQEPALKLEEAKLPGIPEWMVQGILSLRDFDSRLQLLATKLEQGEEVHQKHLKIFMPPLGESFEKIDREFQPSTVWYLAATRFYRDPFDALHKILENIEAGNVCTIRDGKEFYYHHKKWVAERGSLGQVNTSSLGLFFRERIQLGANDKDM